MIAKVSCPASTLAITSSWPARKRVMPNLSRSSRARRADLRGICDFHRDTGGALPRSNSPGRGFGQGDPHRRVVAGPLATAIRCVDVCVLQSRPERGAEQEEVHAEAGIAAKRVRIDPERIHLLLRVQMADGIGPSLRQQ